jgi:hypothetical protein
MFEAIVQDLRVDTYTRMNAESFEREIAGNTRLKIVPNVPDWRSRFVFTDPDTAAPMHFRGTHWQQGYEKRVRACFARAAGYGDDDHVFDRTKTSKSIQDALREGYKILLSLNADLSYRALDYRKMKMTLSQPLERWMEHNRDRYLSVSVKSVDEALQTIKSIYAFDPNAHKTSLFALYRGGVMPYSKFYIGKHEGKLGSIFDGMKGLYDALPRGETRAIGFPRLMRFVPTKSTLDEKGVKGLKGNYFWRPDCNRRLFNQLVFSEQEKPSDSEYIKRFQAISQSRDGVYVLAAPMMTRARQSHPEWQMLRWIINDFDRQVTPAINTAPAQG